MFAVELSVGRFPGRWALPQAKLIALGVALVLLLAGIAVASRDRFPTGELVVLLAAALFAIRWRHADIGLKRQLALSSTLTDLFNPRQGLDQALYALCDVLCTDYRADVCLIVMGGDRSFAPRLYRSASPSAKGGRADRIDAQFASCLLQLPEQAALFNRRSVLRHRPSCRTFDGTTLQPTSVSAAPLAALANLLEVDSIVSVPLRSRHKVLGRVHVASRSTRYRDSDVRFLTHALVQAGVMIENVQLIDRLALQVAAEERRRISRDLHDGTIQPYIGLKLGLEALRRNIGATGAIAREVDELINLAADGISQLRDYVGSLKGAAMQSAACDRLVPAVRRQARKFSEFYGIRAQVVGEIGVAIGSRTYDEVMQIVREGLSNIRRHTAAEDVTIRLDSRAGWLRLELVNDHGGAHDFFPRSIGERAQELGGQVTIESRNGGCTAVVVQLPL